MNPFEPNPNGPQSQTQPNVCCARCGDKVGTASDGNLCDKCASNHNNGRHPQAAFMDSQQGY